jgi:hypothetical protein
LRFDRYLELVEGATPVPVTAYVVVQVPKTAAVESSDVLSVVQRLVSALQEDDSGLDLMDEIFVNQEQ